MGGKACPSIFTHRSGGWTSTPKIDFYLPLNGSDKQIPRNLFQYWILCFPSLHCRSPTDGLAPLPFTWDSQASEAMIAPAFHPLHQQRTLGRVPRLPGPSCHSAAVLDELAARAVKTWVCNSSSPLVLLQASLNTFSVPPHPPGVCVCIQTGVCGGEKGQAYERDSCQRESQGHPERRAQSERAHEVHDTHPRGSWPEWAFADSDPAQCRQPSLLLICV